MNRIARYRHSSILGLVILLCGILLGSRIAVAGYDSAMARFGSGVAEIESTNYRTSAFVGRGLLAVPGQTSFVSQNNALLNLDTDDDGIPDVYDPDNDNDGLTDLEEYGFGTDPNLHDTDGDGMPDGWEVAHGLNPLVADQDGDPDMDGLTNLQEYKADIAPTNLDLAATDDSNLDSDNFTNQTEELTISGTAEDGALVELFANGNPLGVTTVASGTSFSVDLSLSQGSYGITAVQTLVAGYVSAPSAPLPLTVDTTLPSVQINEPENLSKAKPNLIVGNAVDSLSGVVGIEIQISLSGSIYLTRDGGVFTWKYENDIADESEKWLAVTVADPWVFTALNVGFVENDYVLMARVTDLAGNVTISSATTFTYADPDISLTINATAGAGGTISPAGAVIVGKNANQSFTFTPDYAYRLASASVTVDGESVLLDSLVNNTYTFYNVTDDHSIAATFGYVGDTVYTIDASAGLGGAISPVGPVGVTYGNSQSFVVSPEAGYQIGSVSVDGALVNLQTILDNNNTYMFENVTDDLADGSNHWIQVGFSLIYQAAPTTISFDLSSSTILLGETVDVSGKLTRLPDLGIDLSGVPVSLAITAPDNTTVYTETQTYNALGHFSLSALDGFDQKGLYSIQATFAGSESLFVSSSETKSLLVGAQAGYAVLIQGKLSGDNPEGLASHQKTVRRIYDKLKRRGFIDENIFFFSDDDSLAGWDQYPVKSAINTTFTEPATVLGSLADRMSGSPAPLYVIMVDHGNRDTFYIGDEQISPADLQGWLATLEGNLAEGALAEPRVIVVGACFSGTFVSQLSGPNRIVVTSAAGDEESFKGPQEPDGIRSGEFFLEEFFKFLEMGESLKKAFETATDLTEQFTRRGGDSVNSNTAYFDKAMQHPLLDDNGDGFGSNQLSDHYGDGQVAADVFLGVGVSYDTNSADNPADLLAVSETLFLDENTSEALLWARANDDTQVLNGWFEIRSPATVLVASGGTEQLEIDLDRHFMALNSAVEPSRWEDLYAGFGASGKYEAFYFVRDAGDNSLISSMQRSVVYKNRPDNQPPSWFTLESPVDDGEEKTVLLFDWQDASDDDGLTYTLLIASDPDFNIIVYSQEEIEISTTFITPDAGLVDQTDYFWKVVAVDSYGARTESPAWSFTTNNTNSFPGFISGIVCSQLDMSAIAGALVSVNVGGEIFTTQALPGGQFLLEVPAGTAQISSAPAGYQLAEATDITVGEGGATRINLMVLPEDATVDTTPPVTTAAPVGRSYAKPQLVTLTCSDQGGSGCADIYYTLDGSEPTIGSPIYSAPFIVSSSTTVKFFAKDLAGMSEPVKSERYDIIPGDINSDGLVDLTDAILVMRILTGDPGVILPVDADINYDNRIGMVELLFVMQKITGLRD